MAIIKGEKQARAELSQVQDKLRFAYDNAPKNDVFDTFPALLLQKLGGHQEIGEEERRGSSKIEFGDAKLDIKSWTRY